MRIAGFADHECRFVVYGSGGVLDSLFEIDKRARLASFLLLEELVVELSL